MAKVKVYYWPNGSWEFEEELYYDDTTDAKVAYFKTRNEHTIDQEIQHKTRGK